MSVVNRAAVCCVKGLAVGDLYHDDFHSFQYKSGKFVHRQFTLADNKLTSR